MTKGRESFLNFHLRNAGLEVKSMVSSVGTIMLILKYLKCSKFVQKNILMWFIVSLSMECFTILEVCIYNILDFLGKNQNYNFKTIIQDKIQDKMEKKVLLFVLMRVQNKRQIWNRLNHLIFYDKKLNKSLKNLSGRKQILKLYCQNMIQ